MIYGEPKSASAVLPIVAILMAMAGCILVLLSNADRGDEKQGRVGSLREAGNAPEGQIPLDFGPGDLANVPPDLLTPGDEVIVVDDVITTGATLVEASAVLSEAGFRVRGAVALAATPKLG